MTRMTTLTIAMAFVLMLCAGASMAVASADAAPTVEGAKHGPHISAKPDSVMVNTKTVLAGRVL